MAAGVHINEEPIPSKCSLVVPGGRKNGQRLSPADVKVLPQEFKKKKNNSKKKPHLSSWKSLRCERESWFPPFGQLCAESFPSILCHVEQEKKKKKKTPLGSQKSSDSNYLGRTADLGAASES